MNFADNSQSRPQVFMQFFGGLGCLTSNKSTNKQFLDSDPELLFVTF